MGAAATLAPIRGGNPRAMISRALTMYSLEAAIAREAQRMIDLAREAGASDIEIACALSSHPDVSQDIIAELIADIATGDLLAFATEHATAGAAHG